MKYFSHSNQFVNAECQNCGKVLKIPRKKCTVVVGGLSVTPAVICQCGKVSSFIDDTLSEYQKNESWAPRKNDHHMPELIDFVERLLPLNEWNFRMSTQYIYYSDRWSSVSNAQNYYGLGYPIVFYDSEKCRIRVEYSWSPREYERSINIHYGRLEVPDTANTLLTNSNRETSHLYWHSVRYPLYFLDGFSPQEAKNAKHPLSIIEFEQSDLAKGIRSEPEKDILLHAAIWKTYGQKLFDIFDTQNKDLWERYTTFVSEYWKTLPQV